MILHIKGSDNIVADSFSRLLLKTKLDEDLEIEWMRKIPRDKYVIIETAHNSRVGHGGVDRTMEKLRVLGHSWYGMRSQVKRFIALCPCC